MIHPIPPAFRRFAEFLAANPSPAEVVEGQFYWVPCATLEGVRWRRGTRCKHVPLLGTVHEDKDIIGFYPWHIHVDTRFLTTTDHVLTVTRDAITEIRDDQRLLATPFCLTGASLWSSDIDHSGPTKWTEADLSVRKLKARRSEPAEWPKRHFQRQLEDTYADASAVCGACPHRQIPLSAGRDMGNGVRQCAGHGLCWDREGRMVRQEVTQ